MIGRGGITPITDTLVKVTVGVRWASSKHYLVTLMFEFEVKGEYVVARLWFRSVKPVSDIEPTLPPIVLNNLLSANPIVSLDG